MTTNVYVQHCELPPPASGCFPFIPLQELFQPNLDTGGGRRGHEDAKGVRRGKRDPWGAKLRIGCITMLLAKVQVYESTVLEKQSKPNLDLYGNVLMTSIVSQL